MYQRLRSWLRGPPSKALPRERPGQGHWLAGVYHEPKSTSFMVLGQRSLHYRLYLPSKIDPSKRLALLLMLHGCSQSVVEFAEGTRMNRLAETHGCAVLYPEQSKRANSLRCWNWFAPEVLAGKGEAALLVKSVQHIIDHHPIDPARVYVAGLSAGGAMAAVLCATHGNRFAACAIHSGIMFHAATSPLQAVQVMRRGVERSPAMFARLIAGARNAETRLVPTLIIHGAADETVNPLNAEQFVEQVRLLAESLDPQSVAPASLGEATWFEAGGRRYREQNLYQGSNLLVRSILIEGLQHAWSGGEPKHKFFDPAGPDASGLIIEFLLRYRLPERADLSAAPPSSVAI